MKLLKDKIRINFTIHSTFSIQNQIHALILVILDEELSSEPVKQITRYSTILSCHTCEIPFIALWVIDRSLTIFLCLVIFDTLFY